MKLVGSLLIIQLAFMVTWLSTGLLIRFLISWSIVDNPNDRSSHKVPTPRGGGIGILLGLAAALAAAYGLGLPVVALPILTGALVVAIGGVFDDALRGIPPLVRLAVQTGAASWVIWNTGALATLPFPAPLDLQLGPLGTMLSILWIVAVCNFFNFLDGIDGYAAAQGLLAGFGLLLLGYDALATVGLALIGACSAFLFYNWHPARVFMGDVGSGALGFFLAALPFAMPPGPRETSAFAIGLFLWFFLSDGLFTLLARLSRREKVWTAHRSHLYQRLAMAGMAHDSLVLTIGAAAVPLILLTALSCRYKETILQWMSLLFGMLGFVAYVGWTHFREAHASSDGVTAWRRGQTPSITSHAEPS